MKNSIKKITFLTSMFLLQIILAQDWELTMTAQDVSAEGSSDYIRIGYCDGCHDGFHFGEDEYDLPNGGNTYADIQVFNYDWLGTQDENGNTCNNPNFYVDKRSLHGPEFLSEWSISGSTYGLPQNTQIELSWSINTLIDNIDIFIYIGDIGYDMKNQSSLIIDSDDLLTNFDFETFTESVNAKILSGGCASEGTTEYYFDEDSDGWGMGQSTDYCAGYEPMGWVPNNLDSNDSIFCESNNIDRCDVCDGADECVDCNDVEWGEASLDSCNVCSGGDSGHEADIDIDCFGDCFGTAFFDDCNICAEGNTTHSENSDQDCAGTCFGSAFIDDCGDCDGANQSCIDEIFEDGPQDFIAFIHDDIIDLSWDQPNYPSDNRILGFNIYIQSETTEIITNTTDESFTLSEYSEGTFCVSAYDQFNNESTYACSGASEMVTINLTLHDGPNLISFPALPSDVSLDNIFSSIESDVYGIVTEGQSAARIGDWWVGSLTEIIPTKGYWVILELEDVFAEVNYEVLGFPIDFNIQYELWEGPNLISYIGNDNVPLDVAIPDDVEPYITDIISEGNAAYHHPLAGWLGSLTTFNMGKGYWVKSSQDLELQWELEAFTTSFDRVAKIDHSSSFDFNQSSQQAFYYISAIKGFTPTHIDDKIISYCNGNVTGSRNWNGIYTDIPAMGNDGNDYSEGYCGIGDIPEFKFYDSTNETLIPLQSNDASPWASNGITFISLSAESVDLNLPSNTTIHNAYPNPFNPISTIEYALQADSHIELSIHNVNGEKVETLYDGYKNAGLHQITWNAKNLPSGMYFFTLNTVDAVHTHKLLLLK
ncbi:MAG: T9SS type A sorting domain-containing protein [Candidatus Marinimicrobia bacterium]|nr:T9SS type A sorting domain-containing protein [Candidatus Neomarinimicrobiota bacterium]